MDNIKDLLRNNNYPGRGIILGNTKDGKHKEECLKKHHL